ncbi:replicative DNA helicase (plasmid) [Rhizobium leguminosarum]|nr:replicative DNA helicase [Rhizobium leguminosarum]TBF46381.1 replicative DNA helicase [Rhizobium leguminosarum]
MNDAARKIAAVAPSEQHYREAPNNIEAEQALLGAILMNNDAYYRVSDFLKPIHLYEPLHRKIFEVAGDIIRMGKIANPVTIKTENGRYDGGFQAFNDAVALAIYMAAVAKERDGGLSGISTGIHSLDSKMGGLQRSDLIVLAGRPGMGKTSLATNIAYNIAASYESEVQSDGSMKAKNGGVVGFYSLEMSSEQLATRIISEQTEVSSSKIRRGDINDADFEKLVACSRMMQKVPLYIDQTGGISIAQLSARARRLKRQRGLDVLVVDYIQLMTGSGKSSDNRVQEITQITTGLKALGKELNVPIIALSQLSRQVESRDDKRPQLSDLRESGSIEQDADVVLFVFREEYYVKNSEPRDIHDPKYPEWEALFDKVKGTADVIIAKQRHGPTGTVKLAFQAEFTRFADLADPSFTQYEEQ